MSEENFMKTLDLNESVNHIFEGFQLKNGKKILRKRVNAKQNAWQ